MDELEILGRCYIGSRNLCVSHFISEIHKARKMQTKQVISAAKNYLDAENGSPVADRSKFLPRNVVAKKRSSGYRGEHRAEDRERKDRNTVQYQGGGLGRFPACK